jgi:serine/threonine-protein phosphatase PGAM5
MASVPQRMKVLARARGLCAASLCMALCVTALLPQLAAAAESNYVHTFYLVRHGTYLPDPRGPQEPGPGLTPLGLAQARLVAARLAGMPVRFTAITSSTLTRAQQTAVEIRASLPQVPGSAIPLLSECTPPSSMPAPDAAATGVQGACKQRLDMAFEKLIVPAKDGDRHDVLVCHGNVIRYFVTKALGIDTRLFANFGISNASLTILRVRADGVIQVMAVGDAGHIPPNLQSYGGDADPQLVAPALGAFAAP